MRIRLFASPLLALCVGLTLAAGPAAARGYQTCGNQAVGDSVRRCPDGTPPMYHAQDLSQPSPATRADPRSRSPDRAVASASSASDLFGVWHTGVTGGVWQSPSAVPGYDLLHIRPGVMAGDLTIDPGGRYAWNSYGGKVGRWKAGDAEWPIVLVDTVERRLWKVALDKRHPGKIFIWDGTYTYFGRR